ncbi:MAG: T9SS C-terminal target domain-containing protein [Chitinophagaceae bacterium]|nr:MAG: T9SS C-terminal target domain-containing protein [Chitinophagaceae bacterium]
MKSLKTKFFFIFLFLLTFSQLIAHDVVINEMMSSNGNTIADEDGDFEDWIELYNKGSETVNLKGFSISDKSSEPQRWIFPDVEIEPGGFLLIFASGKDRKSGQYLHTNFKISSEGEPLLFSDNENNLIDEFPPVILQRDHSFGRKTDGGSVILFFEGASPGASNNFTPLLNSLTYNVHISHEAGFYGDSITVDLSAQEGVEIFYTLDGSVPDINSFKYEQPLVFDNRENDPTILSLIPTGYKWKQPAGSINKINVLKTAAFKNGRPVSPVETRTYIISPDLEDRYTFPVISISTDKRHFFDYNEGIYIQGVHFDGDRNSGNFSKRGKHWEKPAYMEYFDNAGELALAQDIGVRIHGSGSRKNPQKSLRLYARSFYGESRFNYPFFPDKPDLQNFKRLILSASVSSPRDQTLFRDELTHHLIRGLDLDYQAFIPVVVFINGEYWGIHNLKERQDRYYLENNHNIDPDNIDLLEGHHEVKEGSFTNYESLINYLENNDMSKDEHYQHILNLVEIDNFIDYHIIQLFFANWDWPHNNIAYWRPRTEDGKWRWLFFDCDACMLPRLYRSNSLEFFLNPENLKNQDRSWAYYNLHFLLKNDNFRVAFYNRMIYHADNTFSPEKVVEAIQHFRELYYPEIHEQVNRWNSPLNISEWEKYLSDLESFALLRPAQFKQDIQKFFGSPFTVYPNPSSGDFYVKTLLNSTKPKSYRLFNLSGILLSEVVVENPSSSEADHLNFQGLLPGVYFLQIQFNNQLFQEKIVIQ